MIGLQPARPKHQARAHAGSWTEKALTRKPWLEGGGRDRLDAAGCVAHQDRMTDLPTLQGPSVPPASGVAARALVILLHGYGSNGDDLIGLAPYWRDALPDNVKSSNRRSDML